MNKLVELTSKGLYCRLGDFYVDPWCPTKATALITHGHADHARYGQASYIATAPTVDIMRVRIGEDTDMRSVEYRKPFRMGAVEVEFFSAGHIIGSAQVRISRGSHSVVITGDYKRDEDPSCEDFDVATCDTLITESTFGLPIYQWEPAWQLAKRIIEWRDGYAGPTLLFCYALGKAQRILAELARLENRVVYVHGAMPKLIEIYRKYGVKMVPTQNVAALDKSFDFSGQLVLAPPSAHRSTWMKRFKNPQTSFASGWMAIRGNRRRRGYEQGFILSDHADWSSLIRTVKESKAKKVYVTHGQSDVFARYLREEMNIDAEPLQTLYQDEGDD